MGFKRTINWNKYESKKVNQAQNRYLDFLINPNFQRVNWLFLLFENEKDREGYKKCYLPTVEIKKLQCHNRWNNFLIKR